MFEEAATELDRAAAHCRVSAQHFRDGVVPRAAAHAWAALGHIREAEARLDEQAKRHSKKAQA